MEKSLEPEELEVVRAVNAAPDAALSSSKRTMVAIDSEYFMFLRLRFSF
jgi:hypothetical protein